MFGNSILKNALLHLMYMFYVFNTVNLSFPSDLASFALTI
jgi:hypothetical protein